MLIIKCSTQVPGKLTYNFIVKEEGGFACNRIGHWEGNIKAISSETLTKLSYALVFPTWKMK